jgi:hypothetical protein
MLVGGGCRLVLQDQRSFLFSVPFEIIILESYSQGGLG